MVVPWLMSESCISVSTSGKYVANLFCQDEFKACRNLGLESRENAIIFQGVECNWQCEILAVSLQVIQAADRKVAVMPSVQGNLCLRCALLNSNCGWNKNKPLHSPLSISRFCYIPKQVKQRLANWLHFDFAALIQDLRKHMTVLNARVSCIFLAILLWFEMQPFQVGQAKISLMEQIIPRHICYWNLVTTF